MKRWPHRQISGINRALVDLESQHDAAKGGEAVASVVEELCELHRKREVIIEVRACALVSVSVCVCLCLCRVRVCVCQCLSRSDESYVIASLGSLYILK